MSDRDLIQAIRIAEEGQDGLNAFLSFAESASQSEPRSPSEAGSPSEPGWPSAVSGPLSGMPVAIKDNLVTLDLPTTCGSRLLEDYRSPFEATSVRRVREAGGFIVGKTNLDEFGMGSSTENSAFGPTLNPHDRGCVPGGSSGGSAAAVAAGYVPMALGSDTGGSVRQPAALCGIVGIKPTYGRVSRYGLVAFASSLDQVGTFGRTVRDATLLLDAVSGYDPRDPTSARRPDEDPFADVLEQGVEGLTVGVPAEYFPEALEPELRGHTDAVLAGLERAGATLRPVSLPHTELAIPCYYVLAPAEASSNLARFDGVRYGSRADAADVPGMYQQTRAGMGREVKRRIMLGTYALSAGYYDQYYGAAQRARALIRADFERVFDDGVDLLFTPTTPGPAFALGERLDDPLEMYLSDVFTTTANLAGIPGVSVPIGAVDGLPVGGQLLGPWWQEGRLLAAARTVERVVEEGV